MREKKLILYLRDAEYGKRLMRFLNGRRHPMLRPMMVTDREEFWRSREKHEKTEDICYLTDDLTGEDMDSRGTGYIWFLDEATDSDGHRIGVCQRADRLYADLLQGLGLSGEEGQPLGAPPAGVYGVFSPGEEGQVVAALLSQELSGYGNCLYVNLSEFPFFYGVGQTEETMNLGELFFRLEQKEYDSLVRQASVGYGAAMRLPTVAHFRDLWDISDEDRDILLRRLQQECELTYVVVLCGDVREALPVAEVSTRFYPVSREGAKEAVSHRWKRYAGTEEREMAKEAEVVEIPHGWENWIRDLESRPPEEWLKDERKRSWIRNLTERG